MSKRVAALLLSVAFLAAACGSGEDDGDGGVPSIDDVTAASASPEAESPATGSSGDDEAAVLAFSGCMREEGIDFPDPKVDSEGNVGFDLPAMQGLTDMDEAELEAAFEECIQLLEGVSFGFERIFEADFQDDVLEFAECMRANGFDMPDPDFAALTTTGEIFPGGLDLNDPDFEVAFEACQDTLPGIPGLATE